MDEIERAIERWLTANAPQHRGHHVQIGGGAVLCVPCGLTDLTENPTLAELVLV